MLTDAEENTPLATAPPHSIGDPQMAIIAAVIAELRPAVQQDGGDLELVTVKGDKVFVRLSGACTTCSLAGQTLGGIRRRLMVELEMPVWVLPAPAEWQVTLG
jgi:Fe-S cluster biogenesis protein NfuA